MSDSFKTRYGPWALVAGASVGLGAEFASQLARRGLHLLLLARRGDLLADLANRLKSEHGVEVRTASVDLAHPELLAQVRDAARDLEIGLVVYNAGYSLIGPFLDQDLDEKLKIIDVNCRGPVVLAHEFGKAMAARGRGGILLMTSLAGSQGSPLVATYAATKAFDLVLAESLWEELGRHGVDVLGCRAGATRTPNYVDSKPQGNNAPVQEPAAVVSEALAALGRKPSVVTGTLNKLAAFFTNRLLPRRLAIRLIGNATRRMYGN